MKVLSFKRGISQEGTTLLLTDITDTYGTDLPARDALALIPYITFQKSGGELQVISPAAHSPLDVVTFSIDVTDRDGVYYGRFYALPLYSGGDLDDDVIVFDTNDDKIKKMIDGTLTEVSVASLADEEVSFGELNSLIQTSLVEIRNELTLIVVEKQKDAIGHVCEMDEYYQAKFKRDYVTALWYYSHIKFCAGEYAMAQQGTDTGLDFGKKALCEYNQAA
jgi:hypothetical protein